ncbi:glycogen/starch/alpha-glucan phosphorylase [Leptospira sp. GIMC2001]|uniref:glycogen/starch/alpha-glucan phosphorylase n=1 Tax=Leptospira sp. GIMC2001 TaxID=1513297 RepID=UPI00234A6330|nr:glycogen/starch/alpha-glucan phosphorylase [Leptospira sp. GIMC2001]WCL50269.1 glycogen/starch/alpha-glucan phosphorylase [Leptospira sp. GIMC2001]
MTEKNSRLIQLLEREQSIDPASIESQFCHHLEYTIGKTKYDIKNEDIYKALGYTIRDFLIDRLNETHEVYENEKPKKIYYFSLEFLIGRTLHNALLNLGLYDTINKVISGFGFNLADILEYETDAGLGNGGLGRLAACFLDSLATLDIPGFGYGIRYDYGIFNQIVANGYQVEMPDHWDADGIPYEIVRPDRVYNVNFYGHVEQHVNAKGNLTHNWIPTENVMAAAHDYPIPGYNTSTVNYLRLWTARSSEEFNFDYFNHGDYMKAVEDKQISENISKVLYPNDTTEQGKLLRLKQQYFMVTASLQDILTRHKRTYGNYDNLNEKVAIQLNDTHPSIAIAELMRILVDSEEWEWDRAWKMTTSIFAYTNHTVLPEALETWSVGLIEFLLPRHMQIINEINFRFLNELRSSGKMSEQEISDVSIFEEHPNKRIRMANLAIVGSNKVNGVAALHSELIKTTIFKAFYKYWPEKFTNKTNGITPRRWLVQCNPNLAKSIASKIGEKFPSHLDELRNLEKFADDSAYQDDWRKIKLANKEVLAKIIKAETGVLVDPHSLFDVQIKRFHEYKRQLLNVLNVVGQYRRIKENPHLDYTPRTVIFGGKAAPGYYMAKLIIKLINSIADVVNKDPDVRDRLKLIFLPNYRVSLAEKIIPATELSEQISTAGMEASGTGNMKFALNGALTVGTLDGANVEIREEVGEDNIYIFGLEAHEVMQIKSQGYNPGDYIQSNPELTRILRMIGDGFFANNDHSLFAPIHDTLAYSDTYLLMADYDSYDKIQMKISKDYLDQKVWTRKSILNTARMGKFSSDRTIQEYCDEIWKVKAMKRTKPRSITNIL